MPIKNKVPVKTSHSKVARLLIGEGVIIDNVNDGTDNVCWVSGNSVEERLQPARRTLTVTVEICQHLGQEICQR